MHVLQCQMRERRSARTLPNVAQRDTNWARSTRTLPECVRHDMIQSGRTCVQMTDHITLLRDANTCRTWYTTLNVKASCALSWCSKQVNILSVQSRYSAVEAWIAQRHRSHVGGKRFRLNIADLFLSNEVSGARAAALFEDAGAAGAAHIQDLRTDTATCSASGRRAYYADPHVDAEHAGGRGATSAVFADSRDPRCHWPALG